MQVFGKSQIPKNTIFKIQYLETVSSQQNTSIWKKSDHNKIQAFGNTSQITTNYKYLETPVGIQQNTSTGKQSGQKEIQVFGNTSQIKRN